MKIAAGHESKHKAAMSKAGDVDEVDEVGYYICRPRHLCCFSDETETANCLQCYPRKAFCSTNH